VLGFWGFREIEKHGTKGHRRKIKRVNNPHRNFHKATKILQSIALTIGLTTSCKAIGLVSRQEWSKKLRFT
jgi:hypothetical protein